MERKSQICIVGIGAVTAVGLTAASTAAAVRAGIPGFRDHPTMVDRQGEPMVVAAVSNFVDEVGGARFIRLATQALNEALLPVVLRDRNIGTLSIFLGLPPNRPGRPVDLEQQLTDGLGRVAGVRSVSCIATGHSAGLIALEAASREVLAHPFSFYVAGGVDSYLEPDTLEWLEKNDQLHGGPNAYGFLPGEAAGFCVVCSQQAAERFQLNVLTRVWTVATESEKNSLNTDTVCLGKGLTEVFRKVFSEFSSAADRIDHTICDMNGEPHRADEYGFTMARLSRRFINASEFLTPADCWGDIGSASGPLFVSLVTAARARGYSKGQYNLLWTSSESGERSAAILQNDFQAKN